jgi:hypothetical protein
MCTVPHTCNTPFCTFSIDSKIICFYTLFKQIVSLVKGKMVSENNEFEYNLLLICRYLNLVTFSNFLTNRKFTSCYNIKYWIYTVRQKLSTTWLVSIISFLIMKTYFKSVCCFRYLYTHTYLPMKQVIDRFLFMCIWQGV